MVLQNLLLSKYSCQSWPGITAAQTSPGKCIDLLKDDFDTINNVLTELIADVEKSLATIWPTLELLLLRHKKTDRFLIDFGMKQAKAGPWKFEKNLRLSIVSSRMKQ